MGLLTEGAPLPWDETKKWTDHVRKHGVLQFIELYKKLQFRKVLYTKNYQRLSPIFVYLA